MLPKEGIEAGFVDIVFLEFLDLLAVLRDSEYGHAPGPGVGGLLPFWQITTCHYLPSWYRQVKRRFHGEAAW